MKWFASESPDFGVISSDQIEASDYFYIAPQPNNRLFSILDLVGIRSYLWVLKEQPDRCILVDGYARWEWAKKTGCDHLPCIVFPISTSKEELLKARILVKISERLLSLEEKAVIVEKLSQFYSTQEIEQRFFPPLGLPLKPGLYRQLIAIATASGEFRQAIRNGLFDDKVALRLALWDERSRQEAIKVFSQIQCSVSLQREIIDHVEDMARLENVLPADVLAHPEIESILLSPILNPRQKTEHIRSFLKSRLFPHLTEREARFRQFIATLGLPHGVDFKPPDQFEGDDWEVRIRFTKPEELIDKLKTASEKLTLGALKKICYGE